MLLLIRPAGSNDRLANSAQSFGWPVIESPMTEIQAVDGGSESRQLAMRLDRFDHVIFISQHAVLTGLPRLSQFWPQWPLHLNWYAVGRQTATTLLSEGISNVNFPEESGSAGLLALPSLMSPQGSTILIVKGVDGLDDLATTLAQRQASVECMTTYRRVPVIPEEFEDRPGGYVIPVYNSMVLPVLKTVLAKVPVQRQVLVALSDRIAEKATAIGFQKVLISQNVGQDAVVASIKDARDWLTKTD